MTRRGSTSVGVGSLLLAALVAALGTACSSGEPTRQSRVTQPTVRRTTTSTLADTTAPEDTPAQEQIAPARAIATSGPQPATEYSGKPAPSKPITGFRRPRQHPFMARNGASNIHNDAAMTDAYATAGPIGRAPTTRSTALGGICGTITFDRFGRLEATCLRNNTPNLVLVDPETLGVVTSLELPPKEPLPPGANPFQDFTGGGYFYLDHEDRAVIPTTNRHLYVVAQERTADGTRFRIERDYDLTGVLGDGERISSALPDWSGRYWFVSKAHGVVGTVDRESGVVRTLTLQEEIENSFAVGDDGGVFVVSDKAMYRLDPGAEGTPEVTWREVYESSGIRKPGQVDAGSGTTPTLMDGGLVAITDNADPMQVVVYRRDQILHDKDPRVVCTQPVFDKGASATENSLIAVGRSLLVENNHGYTGPDSVSAGRTTAPGFARVDVRKDGSGCELVWTNTETSGPSVVAKVSAATGLLYTYTKPIDPSGADGWYFTALDFRTGAAVWSRLAGTGGLFNNNYAGLVLGADGVAYLGVFGGIVSLRDGPS